MYQYRLALESRKTYRSIPMVSGISEGDDSTWESFPQPAKRRCECCPTLLRYGNRGKLCWQCERRMEEWEAKHGKGR